MEELLFGRRYRAIEKIGSGGMADVYRAVDETLGRTVAVKVMHERFASDPEFAARFRQEAQAVANLVSPNIVNMYDWGQDGDTYYIVMEYVRGSDLKRIERDGALSSARVAEIGAQVCSALGAAHGYDVIHRDIKPHNIMVQSDGSVKVMDFGIARAGNTTMTQTGSVLGTAQYLSPEQAQGTHLSAGSDLYSLGIVLYEAATGQLPFEADSPVAVALMQVSEQETPPREVNPNISQSLEAVIVKAMQKSPSDRYDSAHDMRRDLLAVARGAGALPTMILPPADTAAAMPLVAKTAVMPIAVNAAPRSRREARQARDAERQSTEGAMPVATTTASASVAAVGAPAAAAGATRRTKWPWLLVAALLLVGGLAVAARIQDARSGAAAGGAQGAARTRVPDLGSKTASEAVAAIKRAGLKVGSVTEAFGAAADAGNVASQTPRPNATAQSGSAVDLIIGKGPEMATVPDVVGMVEADAFETLRKAGFSPQAVPSQYNNDIPENIVLAQGPDAGTTAVKYSVVNYVLSRGPDPNAPGADGKTRGGGKKKDGD